MQNSNKKMLPRSVLIALFATVSVFSAGASSAAESGVVLLYHHVDDSTPRSTSVTVADFAAQLAFLEREGYTVVPLMDLIQAMEAGDTVADRTVAITFDDAYTSILTGAFPELSARNWPFTIFVNSESVDAGFGAFLSWDELRQLGEGGATIGNHSVSHAHLIRRQAEETEAEWAERIDQEVAVAEERLKAEVGDYYVPVFAYPYGEYTVEIKDIVAAHGLYGVGQQSGAFGPGSDMLAIPRYPIADGLNLVADFGLRAKSKPLPVQLGMPERHIVEDDDPRPELRLILDDNDDVRVGELACYGSGQGRLPLEWSETNEREFSVRPERAWPAGRSKINCTAPARTGAGVYYWYGYVWMRPRADGSWYSE